MQLYLSLLSSFDFIALASFGQQSSVYWNSLQVTRLSLSPFSLLPPLAKSLLLHELFFIRDNVSLWNGSTAPFTCSQKVAKTPADADGFLKKGNQMLSRPEGCAISFSCWELLDLRLCCWEGSLLSINAKWIRTLVTGEISRTWEATAKHWKFKYQMEFTFGAPWCFAVTNAFKWECLKRRSHQIHQHLP